MMFGYVKKMFEPQKSAHTFIERLLVCDYILHLLMCIYRYALLITRPGQGAAFRSYFIIVFMQYENLPLQ